MASSHKSKDITKAKHKGVFQKTRLFFRRLKGHWGIFLLLAISISLSFLNYKPDTFLIGWDSLHPELNPGLDLKRGLFSVWQEYRGTGLLAGMAHAADLPRTLLVLVFSLLQIPLNLIRYLTTFIPLVLGPIGVYFFIHHQVFGKDQDTKTVETASFLGGLFYLLNLGTVQTFFVPFETFTWFYGFFPILIYFLTSYLTRPNIATLLTLAFVSLISAPAFYVETIFVVFLIIILPFIFEFWSHHSLSFKNILKPLYSLFSLIIPQLFWLLPIIFFVLTNGHITTNNHINSVSSPETYTRNLEFGNLKDLALIKGYMFKYLDLGADGKYELLLSTWVNHLGNPLIFTLGIFFFLIILIGIYFGIAKRLKWSYSLLSTFITSSFFLLGGGLLINSAIPLVGELFRSPFTKFSLPLMFCFSIFFAIGTVFLLDLFTFLHSRLTYNLTIFTVFVALYIYISPAFSGNLVNPNMRVQVPDEYFQLFDYMGTQDPATRIANLPQHTFWGWQYYDWGYRGSGFLWYGLRQPILDRAFDVWEKTSEKYYEELSTAIYSDDQEAFENVIDKYAINWLLIDHHLIAPESKSDLGLTTINQFIENNPKFVLDQVFGDKIFLYKAKEPKHQNFLSISSLPINPTLRLSDPSELSDSPTNTPSSQPIFSFSLRPNSQWIFRDNYISLISGFAGNSKTIIIPSLTKSENFLPVKIEYQKLSSTINFRLTPVTPIFFLDNIQHDIPVEPTTISIPYSNFSQEFILEISGNYLPFEIPAELNSSGNYFPLSEIYLPSQRDFSFTLYSGINEDYYALTDILSQSEPSQCYTNKKDRKVEKIVTPNSITLLGTDVVACLSTSLPTISPDRLLGLTFSYHSPTLTTGNVNITNSQFNSSNIPQPLEATKTQKLTRLYFPPSKDYSQVNLLLEAEDTKSIQEVTYKDIFLTVHAPIASTKIKLEKIDSQTIDIPQNLKQIQVSLPLTTTPFDLVETPSSNSLFPESRNCDQFNHGDVVKRVSDKDILYQSRNATQCDYLNLRHLDHSLNYLITLDSQNQKGLHLTTCLENHSSRRCDVFERLGDSNLPQSIIQPIKNPNEFPGFTLHLFNQSFGSRISGNSLKSISVHPIPLTFLQNIVLVDKVNSLPTNPTLRPADLSELSDSPTNLSSSHPYEFLYLVSLVKGRGGEAERDLNLFQARSPYWKALILPDSYQNLSTAQIAFKIIFDYKKLPQLTAIDNGQWFNTWSITNRPTNPILRLSDPSELSDSPPTLIIYFPQYLEFLGLTLLLIFFPVLFLILFIKQVTKKPLDN